MANPPNDLTNLNALNGVTFTGNEVSLGDGVTSGPQVYTHIGDYTQISNNVNAYSPTTTFTISNVHDAYTAAHSVSGYYYQPTFGSFTLTINDGIDPATTETMFVHGFEDSGQGLLVSTDQNLVWYSNNQAINGSSFPVTYENFGVIETTPVANGPVAQNFHGAAPPTDAFHLNGMVLHGNQISIGQETDTGSSVDGVSIDAGASDLSAGVLSINNIVSLGQPAYGINYQSTRPNLATAVINNVHQAYTAGHMTNGHYYMPTFGSFQLKGGQGVTETLYIHGYEDNGRALLVSSFHELLFDPTGDAYEHGSSTPGVADGRFGIISLDPLTQGAPSFPLTFVTAGPGDGSAFVACYAEGSRVLTARGEVAVEDLVVGDEAMTASRAVRPVVWIGSRQVKPAGYPNPAEANPVRIRKGAFGEYLPHRDLVLSPGHAVFVDGVLIPAHALVNGATIVQEAVERIRYFHVELDAHDVLVAEGLPCESYLDDGNRTTFGNSPEHVRLHGRLDPKSWELACAPMVAAGPQLAEVQRRLLQRAEAMGWTRSEEPGLHLVADGVAIAPVMVKGDRLWFAAPAAVELTLVSSASVLAHTLPGVIDQRRLGVAISELKIDGRPLDLAAPVYGRGFHASETRGGHAWRWTDGHGRLTLSFAEPAMLEVAVLMVAPTWKRPAAQLRLVEAS